jgi:phosphoglycolate phosphatase
MPQSLPALIFDLDGTLTDSKPGILGSLRKALDAHNVGDCGSLDRFVGPPVEEWAMELLPDGSDEERLSLGNDYRANYAREGWSNNSVFPGVLAMLTELQRQGFPLYVCTSKFQPFAERIVETFGMGPFFAGVYGDKKEYESHSKVDLLAVLLRERSLDGDSAWMVGDRCYDIAAAHGNNLRCLAAGWGYGEAEECAQADAVAPTPADVLALVLP